MLAPHGHATHTMGHSKKALVTPLYLRRDGDGWAFAGLSAYDRVLSGGLGADGFMIKEYSEAADRDRLFLQLADALGISSEPAGQPNRYRVVTFKAPAPRPISGGCDEGVEEGRSPDMAPHTPPRSSRPGKPVALLDHPRGRGPDMAPHAARRSGCPGRAGAPLDHASQT
jgi:hypothetical protein